MIFHVQKMLYFQEICSICVFLCMVVFYARGRGGGPRIRTRLIIWLIKNAIFSWFLMPGKFEAKKSYFFMIFNIRKMLYFYAVGGVLGE